MNTRQDAVLAAVRAYDPSGKSQQRAGWARLVLNQLAGDELPEAGVFALCGRAIGYLWATDRRLLCVGQSQGLFVKRTVCIEHSYHSIKTIQTKVKDSLHMITVSDGSDVTQYKTMPATARSQDFVALAQSKLPNMPDDQAASVSSDLIMQLERLSRLKKDGMLTEEEYSAAKKKLLGL